jgi:dephospho-CoA kinase
VSLLRVALTGGIATGKSQCADRFRGLGVPVIDADVLAHAAVAPGTPGLTAVAARFGPAVILPSGALDRPALGQLIFADPTARLDLEAIIHPLVYKEIAQWFAEPKPIPQVGFRLADIPLLYETGRASDFDRVIVAVCPTEMQLARLAARGFSDDEARQRIASQLPLAEKVRMADFVIDTSGSFEQTDQQVTDVWERLSKRR